MTVDLSNLFSHALTCSGRNIAIARVIPLVPEASTRRYYRLLLPDGTTLVGVSEDPATATNTMPLVAQVQSFLRRNAVAVPEILFADPAAGVMLQQDLGDLSLNQALKENPDKADLYYQDAISRMFGWQRLVDDSICPAFRLSFDVEKMMFEFDFFITHTLLGYYRADVADTEVRDIRAAFLRIAEELAAPANKVFTHRDYHSRNIMMVGSAPFDSAQGPPPHYRQFIIDFQDARLGLMQYDLCSLLCDAYAPITPERRARLIEFAFENGKDIHRQSRAEFDHFWALSAFQRLVKAMGTFGRQAALGRADFAAYLDPARRLLQEIIAQDNNDKLFFLESVFDRCERSS